MLEIEATVSQKWAENQIERLRAERDGLRNELTIANQALTTAEGQSTKYKEIAQQYMAHVAAIRMATCAMRGAIIVAPELPDDHKLQVTMTAREIRTMLSAVSGNAGTTLLDRMRKLEAVADAVKEAFNKSRAGEDCNCRNCQQVKDIAQDNFECETCGYNGRPATIECSCYDFACHGGDSRGAGCFHGCVVCPICDDGDNLSQVIKDVRAALENNETTHSTPTYKCCKRGNE